MESFFDGKIELRPGDCRDVIRAIPDCSIDSVVTDPPYALVSIVKRFGGKDAAPAKDGDVYARSSAGFMGKQWDTGETAFATEFWTEVFRVLKPGGHVAAFSGTRTYHRMAVAIEDAGFEIRDQLAWMYGSGFPKSHDVSKGIDKAAGATREKIATGAAVKRMIPGADQNKDGWEKTNGLEYVPGIEIPTTEAARQWQGWGTALKPAWEPICLARKPLDGTVAANVLEHGTGALNIDGCRVGTEGGGTQCNNRDQTGKCMGHKNAGQSTSGETFHGPDTQGGRWPANIVHDGSDEVLAGFPETTSGSHSGNYTRHTSKTANTYGERAAMPETREGDSGSAARFFYTAKADKLDRIGSKHPTVKPVDLMQWLCRLITPPGGLILDPFSGTGTTGEAAYLEGFRAVLIEREEEYQADIRKRMGIVVASSESRKRAASANKPVQGMGIFEGLE